MVIDALDDVSVGLELCHGGGRERDPGCVQFGERDRLVAGLAQSLQQQLLLASAGVIDGLSPSSEIGGASSEILRRRAFPRGAAVTRRLATAGCMAAGHWVAPRSTRALCGRGR